MHSNISNSTSSSSCWKVFLIYTRCMIYLSCYICSHFFFIRDMAFSVLEYRFGIYNELRTKFEKNQIVRYSIYCKSAKKTVLLMSFLLLAYFSKFIYFRILFYGNQVVNDTGFCIQFSVRETNTLKKEG